MFAKRGRCSACLPVGLGTVLIAAFILLGLWTSWVPLSSKALLRPGRRYQKQSVGYLTTYGGSRQASEQAVNAVLPIPPVLITSNLPLTVYEDKNLGVLADCLVRGPAVEKPVIAGQLTYLIVDPPQARGEADGKPRQASVEGQQAWKKAEFAYVTFESDELVFGGWGTRSQADTFRIDFRPPQAGTFAFTVDLLANVSTWPIHHRRNTTVDILPAADDENGQLLQKPVKRCQGLPDTGGMWLKCASAHGLSHPEECMRWGYSFRPNHGSCFYENWAPRDLLAYATEASQPKQWILIAGTSRIRGLFLSAADHLLDGRRGEFEAAMGKCWGRMDVEIGNIRLTFRDFRSQSILKWPQEAGKHFQCHGDNQVTYDDNEYARNSSLFLQHIFDPAQQPDGLTPTHLVFEYLERQNPTMYRDLIFNVLPSDWDGAATAVFFRSPSTGSMESPGLNRTYREEWVTAATGTGTQGSSSSDDGGRTGSRPHVDIIDTLEIIRPWLRVSEFGIHRASQHWHSCTTPEAANKKTRENTDLHTTRPVPFAVQGLVTDQLAQMVFNKVLGSRPSRKLTLATTSAAVALEEPVRPGLKVCMDCPPALLPYNIKLEDDLICHDAVPQDKFKGSYTPQPLPACAAWCLEQPPVRTQQTKSGVVEVRNCRENVHPT